MAGGKDAESMALTLLYRGCHQESKQSRKIKVSFFGIVYARQNLDSDLVIQQILKRSNRILSEGIYANALEILIVFYTAEL